ncbi:MAG: 30S ribosomal protein S9 [Bacteroidales bacterium]|nr:30S ribosomal protein S9 [Bacteroidales bacterium]
MEIINAIGRRKSAIARVYLDEGKGNITINETDYREYFKSDTIYYMVTQPLVLLNVREKYDIKACIDGGGIKGQAEALRLGISRALIKANAEFRPALKTNGFLTRDPREVERKKAGRPKARKRFQFSKR